MIEILFSWFIILIAAILFGYGAMRIFYKQAKYLFTIDVFVLSGLMLLTVYAEIFSLFYKVGIMACFILGLIGIALFIWLFIKEKEQLLEMVSSFYGKSYIYWLMGILGILATLLWTIQTPQHYDTALYHAQSVRWIEEYGVVPGLGNLHNRFAYNSAFMPLQALFSLEWLFDRSLHSLNGFICCVFLIWAVVTNNFIAGKKLLLSDFFKFAMVIYICINKDYISSLSSDILAMLLTIYILTKWSELRESGEEDALSYAFICMLCVWAATVKLSTATGVLLAVFPIVLLVKNKDWKTLVAHICAGVLIALPWLIRNVIISGYLIYPYAKIDFFNFDWEMLPSILEYDKQEIAVWGRKIEDVARYYEPIYKWVGVWFKAQSAFEKCLTITGMFSIVIVVGLGIYKLFKKQYADAMLYIMPIIGLALWFFSAPLLRYGSAFLLLPTCIVLERAYHKVKMPVKCLCLLVLIPLLGTYVARITQIDNVDLIKQDDYKHYATYEVNLNGVTIWIPEEGDQTGYWAFPSSPHIELMSIIELRGTDIADGFKVKEEFEDSVLKSDGYEWVQ